MDCELKFDMFCVLQRVNLILQSDATEKSPKPDFKYLSLLCSSLWSIHPFSPLTWFLERLHAGLPELPDRLWFVSSHFYCSATIKLTVPDTASPAEKIGTSINVTRVSRIDFSSCVRLQLIYFSGNCSWMALRGMVTGKLSAGVKRVDLRASICFWKCIPELG